MNYKCIYYWDNIRLYYDMHNKNIQNIIMCIIKKGEIVYIKSTIRILKVFFFFFLRCDYLFIDRLFIN